MASKEALCDSEAEYSDPENTDYHQLLRKVGMKPLPPRQEDCCNSGK